MSEDLNSEPNRIDIPPPNKFLGFLKNLFLLLLLVALVVGSFWISFHLGKRILAPVKKKPLRKIEVAIPKPPPSIAGLQRLEELTLEARVPAKVVKPTTKTIVAKKYYPPKGKYFKVQAGYFHVKNNAINLSKKINASGFETYLKKIGRGWRVQVGAFKSKTRALNRQTALKKKGFTSVVVYE